MHVKRLSGLGSSHRCGFSLGLLVLAILAVDVRAAADERGHRVFSHGALIREDSTRSVVYLLFSGHEFADGAETVRGTLRAEGVPASFFLTGEFYRDTAHAAVIRCLLADGHYLGAHSDSHLLYASWTNRESTLVTREAFLADLRENYAAMERHGIRRADAPVYLPPYEWYNREIAAWTEDEGLMLINFTPGTLSNADYTTPSMGLRYIDSDSIMRRILRVEEQSSCGLNGFFLLMHIGTHPERTDKLYSRLGELIIALRSRGYTFARFGAHP